MRAEFQTYLQSAQSAMAENLRRRDECQMSDVRCLISEAQCALHEVQGTAPLVYTALLNDWDMYEHTGELVSLRARMKQVCMQTMQQHAQLQMMLKRVMDACEQGGIRAVLMKGAGLAAYYPTPQQRAWGDIDIFVGVEQYHSACAVMRAAFPQALRFDEELDHYKHYNLIADGVSIEVHRVSIGLQHPLDTKRYARMETAGMRDAETMVIGGVKVLVPEPTFNALMVMFHSWEHVLSRGANMRQLCDLAWLLHATHDRIDGKELKKNLRALCLMDVWQVYMYILVQYLGLPMSAAPFYTTQCAARAERMVEDMLSGCLSEPNSTCTAVPTNRLARKIHTMRSRLANARRIKRYSPAYGRHMVETTMLHGLSRLLAKDRRWE